ncbi:MAG: DUF1634 domain-containing protein [Candidatus Binataceae bacterium]
MPSQLSDEDRILRVWTPVILRTILITAAAVLVGGLIVMIYWSPGFFVDRYRQVQNGIDLQDKTAWSTLAVNATQGDSHAILTIGLMVLTLVPLGRVAFTFFLFLKERDGVFVAATAYVLTGLIVGVLLGRIG